MRCDDVLRPKALGLITSENIFRTSEATTCRAGCWLPVETHVLPTQPHEVGTHLWTHPADRSHSGRGSNWPKFPEARNGTRPGGTPSLILSLLGCSSPPRSRVLAAVGIIIGKRGDVSLRANPCIVHQAVQESCLIPSQTVTINSSKHLYSTYCLPSFVPILSIE